MDGTYMNYFLKWIILELLIAEVQLSELPCGSNGICKSEEDIYRETSYVLPNNDNIVYGQGTLYQVRDFVNITYEDITAITTCDGIKEMRRRRSCTRSSYYPDSIMSSCPYFFRRNIDLNRIPTTVIEASCACSRCIDACATSNNCPGRRSRCKEVYTYIEVLRKHNRQGDYMRVVEPIAQGCSCVHPTPSRGGRSCHQMPLN